MNIITDPRDPVIEASRYPGLLVGKTLAGLSEYGKRRVAELVAEELMTEAVLMGLPEAIEKAKRRRRARVAIDFLRDVTPFYQRGRKQMSLLFSEMESDVLKNLRKTSKAMYFWQKAGFDVTQWLFDRKKWRATFTEGTKKMDQPCVEHFGKRFLTEIGVGSFDMTDPRVIEFLATNAKRAGWSITDTAYESVRTALMDSLADGLSIPKIAEKIKLLFDGMKKSKAENIARTETLKASNRGLYEGMVQSEVVEGVQWLTTEDDRTCQHCMDMDGKTMAMGKPFFEEGAKHTWSDGSTSVFDYEEIITPPLHNLCRCTLLAIVKEVQRRGIVPGFLPRFVIIQNINAWA